MKLEKLKQQTICILGLGVEGTDTLSFLLKHVKPTQLAIADQKQKDKLPDKTIKLIKEHPNIKKHLGPDYLKDINRYDVIIRSPGINPYTPPLNHSKIKLKLTSATNLFLENTTAPSIGITGTKGKSTTASLTHQLLIHAGINTTLVGNIGNPMLTALLNDPPEVFVLELSSHQLIDAKNSPYVAVCLEVFPEHLDYYETAEQYATAKKNITAHQSESDFYIYNPGHHHPAQFAKQSVAKKITYGTQPSVSVQLKNSQINITQSNVNQPIDISSFPLKGQHNQLNITAAIAATLPFSINLENIESAINSLKPLAHRLELVGTYKEITFYNDSLATVPQATIAAIKALQPKLHTLIVGGYDRGVDQTKMVDAIQKHQIKTVIALPDTGHIIADKLQQEPAPETNVIKVDSLQQAVQSAYSHTQPGTSCCLSPAAASFNQFKNYQDRGDQFKKYIKQYGSS